MLIYTDLPVSTFAQKCVCVCVWFVFVRTMQFINNSSLAWQKVCLCWFV